MNFVPRHSCISFFSIYSTVKDEPDDSDNLAALADFKEEDLKEFENVNDFPNGEYIQYLNFSTLFSEK